MFDLFEKVQDIRRIYFLHHCYLMYDEIVPMELNLFDLWLISSYVLYHQVEVIAREIENYFL